METDQYNDNLIEEMLEKSAIEAPENISENIVAALPRIYSGKRRRRSIWTRKKWMITALMAVTIITLITILLAMTALRMISSRARKLLNSEPQNTEQVEQLP